ncbi:MAG: hypothetical protein ACR2IF_03635 [Terriglobales bacterium]
MLTAQTTVTTSGGTSNAVPKFTGSSTIGDSAITENAGNVGIGAGAPEGIAKDRLVGAVIGKALQPLLTGKGAIYVLVSLQ